MEMDPAIAHSDNAMSIGALLRDYVSLTKPEVNLLVLITTAAGFALGSTTPLHVARMFHVLVGTLLVASGTATLNQYLERDYDAAMRRTASRPLPAHRLSGKQALLFGISLSLMGGVYLALLVNLLSSMLALLTLASYLLLYTPLKRRTALCTVVGAVPGAMPPLIGWAAASGKLSQEAWILYLMVFLWQFPHFLAIAWLYREDYARAGFHMLPRRDVSGRFTAIEVAFFLSALVLVSLLPGIFGAEGKVYIAGAAVSGALFLWYGLRFALLRSKPMARHLLHASIVYLPIVVILLVLDKI